MQSVEHCDKKKVDCKVSSACTTTATATTTTSSTSVPPSTSKATIANHTASTAASSQSANEKNTMSATEIKLKNKFCNTNTSPIKTVIEKYKNKIQPCDSSESDEESVSEILLAWLCLRPEYLGDIDEEIPESCSDCEQDDEEVEDEEEDDDESDEEGSDDDDDDGSGDGDGSEGSGEITDDESVDLILPNNRLEALLEAAEVGNENDPALRNVNLALNDAAQELNRMRTETSSRDRNLLSRTLIAACADNDVNTVRRLLGDGSNTINEGTDDGESLLSLACSAGYYELAQVLLAMSAQVEDRGQKNDCTPLMEAASAGHVDIIKLLISHSADVNAQSSTGNTPLMYACAGGHVRAVKELLASGANVEDHNENGHTPLMEAASAGHVEVAKILLEHGAGINTHSNEFKESALTLACYKGHLDMVRFLLEAGADQEHKTDEMHTALMEASMDGHVEVARLLLDSGAQVNMPTDSFESPLTLAACGGHVDLAMLLLERGANIEEVNDEGYTPLMEASREGHDEMAALLLAQGANINAQTEETQETALTLACCGGFLEVADYLLKNGADLEIGASTPLMEAAQEGHLELVRFLLENRANVHAQTQTGDTALTYACENGHTDVAEVLLYYGAELEHESEGGRTPLMKACRAGHICTIKFLINKGADVNRQSTSNDHTPLSLACAGGHQAVVELLLKSGADPFHKLKDNSTMLIEASKGGHIGVVQMLLDYPNSMIPPPPSSASESRIAPRCDSDNHRVQQPQPQPQQQQQPHVDTGATEPAFSADSHLRCDLATLTADSPALNRTLGAISPPPSPVATTPHAIELGHPAATGANTTQHDLELEDLDGYATVAPPFDLGKVISAASPPNLQEVPEAERAAATAAANQQIFQHQVTPTDAAMSLQNILLSSNAKNSSSVELQDSILANMRFLRNQGFKDGLALGLARFGLGNVINNNNNTGSSNNNTPLSPGQSAAPLPNASTPQVVPMSTCNSNAAMVISSSNNSGGGTVGTNATPKQKSVLRKTRQTPAPFELNEMTRVHPFLMDLTKTFVPGSSDKQTQKGGFGEEFKLQLDASEQKSPFQALGGDACASVATNFIPTSCYMDLNSTASNGSASGPCMRGPTSTSVTGTTNAASSQLPNATPPYTAPTPIAAPSEVLPNTAISDRPKVKSVSKKDSKNNRKMAAAAAAGAAAASAAMLSIQAAHVPSPNAITAGQPQQETPSSPQGQILVQTITQPCIQVPTSTASQGQECRVIRSTHAERNSASNKQSHNESLRTSTTSASDDDAANQFAPNETILQLVAQIPNHPLQKIAQKLIVDLPKTATENYFKTATSDDTASTTEATITSTTSPDIADISRIFFEVIRSELNANQMPEFVIHQKPCAAHSNASGADAEITPPESEFEHESNPSKRSAYAAHHDLSMFSVEEPDAKNVYTEIENSLKGFASADLTQQRGRTDCNYEWADDIDVLNVLHGANDWPEVSANFSDYTEYPNFIGLDSACKMRWTGQWPQNVTEINQQAAAGGASKGGTIEEQQTDQQQIMSIEHQLHQQLQQQLCVEQFQLLSQLQHQQQEPISLVPSAMVDLQTKSASKVDLSSIQPQFQVPSSASIANQLQAELAASDSQEQTKFVFNVDTDKTSPSLQLLFQLPNVSGGATGQAQPASGILTAQPGREGEIALEGGGGIIHHPCQLMAQQQQQQQQQNQQLSAPSSPPSVIGGNRQQQQVATQTYRNIPQHTAAYCSSSGSPRTTTAATTGLPPTAASTTSTTAPVATKKTIDKTRRERKTITRQTSSINQPTALQQQQLATGAAQTGVDKTIDVDSETDSNHDTALTLACAGGHEELVELLIQRDANIEHRDKKGFTPLILAATAGHEKVVNILLKHGAELEAQSERTKDTPLSLACSGGRYEVVEILLNVGANKEHRNVSDYTPLSLAASGGYVNIIRLLLNHGAEINSRTGSKLGISPLMLAAMNGHTAAVKMLLDMGSDINAQIETNRNTALTLACFQGRHEVVSLLLDRKANVEHRAKTGLTPLMEAASGGYIDVGRVLLDKGADVNATPVPSSRDTALTIAADKGHLKFVDLLLTRGAAVEVKNKKGNSPLWLAANGGHLSVVKVLKNHNADIDSQDNRRVSCLMAAFRKGHTKVVEFMVNHVTQFPSDQEMTRYIATVSDKDLSEKCKECVKTIRAAKEAQAVKANKNASILLEELDMEKTREESRKAAAARRRERKKKKKMEKKEEKRKQLETEKPPQKASGDKVKGSGSSASTSSAASTSSVADAAPAAPSTASSGKQNKVVPSPEKEETDSGIDAHSQGSYSSTEPTKTTAAGKANSRIETVTESVSATTTATTTTTTASNRKNAKAASSKTAAEKSKKTKSPNRVRERDHDDDEPHPPHSSNSHNSHNGSVDGVAASSTTTANSHIVNHQPHPKESTTSKHRDVDAAHATTARSRVSAKEKERSRSKEEPEASHPVKSTQKTNTVVHAHAHDHEIDSEMTHYFNSTRNKLNKSHDTKPSTAAGNAKQSLSHGSSTFKREEGWKEVSRKSSTQQQQQQHTASSSSVPVVENDGRKVRVPTYAISRVIGRAGSNINAIRAATGAHIEVEKQGKTQNDRWITIKGSAEATKQAFVLITALIVDPEVDILQMLPKVNSNARSVPPSNVGEKSSSSANNSSSSNQTQPLSSHQSSIAKASTSTAQANPVQQWNAPASASQRGNSSNTKLASQSRSNTNRGNENAKKSSTSDIKNNNNVPVDHGGLNALKNTIKNASADTNFGTFAAKLASDLKISDASQSHPSPKHGTTSSSGYSNAIFGHDKSGKVQPPHITASYSSESGAAPSSTAVTNSIANRIISSSPVAQAMQQQPIMIPGAGAKMPPTRQKSNVQLPINPHSQSHEYSLFNNSFASSNQWEAKPTYQSSNNSENYLENDALPKADASKAPGYRGVALNSPIHSKKVTKPETKQQQMGGDTVQQKQKEQDGKLEAAIAKSGEQLMGAGDQHEQKKSDADDLQPLEGHKVHNDHESNHDMEPKSHISPIGTTPAKMQAPVGSQLHANVSQSVIKPPNTSIYSSSGGGDSYPPGIIRPPSLQSLSSNDLPRSLAQTQLRMMPTPLDTMSADAKSQQYFDTNSFRNMNFNSAADMQSAFQHGLGSNQLPMSRLNPRASVFSSVQNNNVVGGNSGKSSGQMPMMNAPYGGRGGGAGGGGGGGNMFQQNPNQNMNANFNPYASKLPFSGQTSVASNVGGGASSQFYNRAPSRPQSQPQAGSTNGRMFSEFTHSSHTSPNDNAFGLDHTNLVMLNASSMSPNGNNNSQTAANKNALSDDNRKMPRPIGTERASWKHNVNVGGALTDSMGNAVDALNQQHSLPPWLLEKSHMQQTQQLTPSGQQTGGSQPWMQYPLTRNPYNDELHLQDQFQAQLPLDYYNTMLPQNPPPMMPSMHYSQLAPPEIGQQDLWDHDKHGWSKWTN